MWFGQGKVWGSPVPRLCAALTPSIARLPLLLTWLATAAYAAAYALQATWRHESLGSNALDLGYEDQVLWNTLHGRFYQFSLLSGGAFSLHGQAPLGHAGTSLLGYHAELSLAPLSLLYAVIPDVRALLALQAVVVCSGALAAYGLARRRLDSAWAGLLVATAYLSSPFVEAELLSDFHTVALDSALVLLLFYAIERRWLTLVGVIGLLAAAAKEDAAVAVALLGLWTLTAQRWHRGGALLLAIGAAFSLVDFFWLIPRFAAAGTSPFLARYSYLGTTPFAMLRTVAQHPGILETTLGSVQARAYIRALVGSSGGLPFLAPLTLLIALPSLTINLLASFTWMRTGMAHYSALILPVLIAAAVEGIRNAGWALCRLGGARSSYGGWLQRAGSLQPAAPPTGVRFFTVLLASGLAVSSIVTHYQLGAGPGGAALSVPIPSAHARLLRRFLAEIPPGDAVSTTSNLAPHLSHRAKLYLFPNVLDAQEVLLDLTTSPFPLSWGDQRLRLFDLLRGGFGVADAADGYVLLRRGTPLRNLPRDTFTFTDGPAGAAASPPLATFGGTMVLLSARIHTSAVIGAGRQESLTLDWTVTTPVTANLILAVWTNGTPRPVPPDFQGETPTLVWRPTSNWQPGDVVRLDVPALPVTQPGPLQIAWFRQDTPNEPLTWQPCVDAAGRPCPLGSHYVVRSSTGRAACGAPFGPVLGPWLAAFEAGSPRR